LFDGGFAGWVLPGAECTADEDGVVGVDDLVDDYAAGGEDPCAGTDCGNDAKLCEGGELDEGVRELGESGGVYAVG
jgi:hypothetical protein